MEQNPVLISNKDLVNYLHNVFQLDEYKKIINNCSSHHEVIMRYQNLGELLVHYFTATGDFSIQRIKTILEDFDKHSDEFLKNFESVHPLDLTHKEKYFKKYIFPLIFDYWKEKLLLTGMDSISNNIKLITFLRKQCGANKFYTHSFNGALYDRVNSEGLNINNELFSEEYKSLFKMVGKDSPYKTGVLCYCEMSAISFGYCVKSPERLIMILGNGESKRKNTETNYEFYHNNLINSLQKNTNIDSDQKDKIYRDVNEMLKFYFGQDKCCISIMKGKNNGESSINIPSKLINSITELGRRLKKYKDSELDILCSNMIMLMKQNDEAYLEMLEKLKITFNKKYPNDNFLNNYLNDTFIKLITRDCLNNFKQAYGNGYEAENGIIPRDQMEIFMFENPSDMYAIHNKKKEQNALFYEVERQLNQLTNVNETNDFGLSYKTAQDLHMEVSELYKKIELLFYNGVIDLKMKQMLSETLQKKYTQLISDINSISLDENNNKKR